MLEAGQLALVGSGHVALRRRAAPVQAVDASARDLAERLFDTMRQEGGVGLAAPQVGVSTRVIVVDVTAVQPRTRPLALINPVIVARRGSAVAVEGCLSLPGIEAPVRRASAVSVQALDTGGEPLNLAADGLLARALQHEIDHLDGILFVDRLSLAARWRLRRALRTLGQAVRPPAAGRASAAVL